MDIEAIAFDVNGTLIDIRTDEGMEEIFRAAGHCLTYQGIRLNRHEVRDLYYRTMTEQRESSSEEFPEYDAVQIWRSIIDQHATDFTRKLDQSKREQLPLFLAEMTRGISRRQLKLYPHVREVLTTLRDSYPLAIITDAQTAWARGELNQVDLLGFFDFLIVSGDHGFRKPDPRLFRFALDRMKVSANKTMYVGNDMYRDMYGASALGMTTVMFTSDQGTKEHPGCVPDFIISDHRELLDILGIAAATPSPASEG
jgi:putative hydrolase of the HAD superfamily